MPTRLDPEPHKIIGDNPETPAGTHASRVKSARLDTTHAAAASGQFMDIRQIRELIHQSKDRACALVIEMMRPRDTMVVTAVVKDKIIETKAVSEITPQIAAAIKAAVDFVLTPRSVSMQSPLSPDMPAFPEIPGLDPQVAEAINTAASAAASDRRHDVNNSMLQMVAGWMDFIASDVVSTPGITSLEALGWLVAEDRRHREEKFSTKKCADALIRPELYPKGAEDVIRKYEAESMVIYYGITKALGVSEKAEYFYYHPSPNPSQPTPSPLVSFLESEDLRRGPGNLVIR